ncbi:hypothetical protein RvY_02721 [Ramazzottius varieornatus]|uniref:Uncharacterized protein n=1 Tax=Ramazzottius varieornatus TaxID=947166 RepID=A0A1D1UV93_RAMVA|nr:hypothetical protein RvY_02721 [Ramazzottius varieornatus]
MTCYLWQNAVWWKRWKWPLSIQLILGLDRRNGTLAYGADAYFVVLDRDLEVLATFIAGQCVWRRDEGRTRHFVRSHSFLASPRLTLAMSGWKTEKYRNVPALSAD